jgi:hypothetical protein
LDSLKKYPAQKGVAAKLDLLGYKSVQIIDIMGGTMSIHVAIKQ